MKAFGDERICLGDACIVVDLGGCTGMDSTFMGTLAGMAARLTAVEGGVLQIADPGERNRRSLEDLGLDFLMEVDPAAAKWRGRMNDIRSELSPPQSVQNGPGQIQRVRHVLEAHQNLSELNERNAREFAGVVSMLQKDAAEKQSLAETDKND